MELKKEESGGSRKLKFDLKLTGRSGKQNAQQKKKVKTIAARCAGKQCLAFDFGSYSTKVAVGRFTRSGAVISHLLEVDNPEHLDASDSLLTEGVIRELKKAMADAGLKTKGGEALCALSSGRYITREIDIPFVENDIDRNGAAAYRISDILSLDRQSYYFSHSLIRRYKDGDNEMCRLMVTAVSKKSCEAYYKILSELGLDPLLLDLDIKGMERHLSRKREEDLGDTVACIDFGFSRTKVDIFEEGRFVQNSSVDFSEDDLTRAIRNVFAKQRIGKESGGTYLVDPETVYRVLVSERDDLDLSDLRSKLANWSRDLSDIMKLYGLNHPNREISTVLIRGGSTQLVWIRAYLEHALKIRTVVEDSADSISLTARAREDSGKIPMYLNALNLFTAR